MGAVALHVAPDLTNAIVDQLQDDTPSLRHCSMVARRWRDRSSKWLFEAMVLCITADPWSYVQWLEEPTPGTIQSKLGTLFI